MASTYALNVPDRAPRPIQPRAGVYAGGIILLLFVAGCQAGGPPRPGFLFGRWAKREVARDEAAPTQTADAAKNKPDPNATAAETAATPAEDATADKAPPAESDPAVDELTRKIASDQWYRAAEPPAALPGAPPLPTVGLAMAAGDAPAAAGRSTMPPRRWRHAGLDALTAAAPGDEETLARLLAKSSGAVAVNATILALRWGRAADVTPLAKVIDDPQARLALRCAAAEALGSEARPAARQAIVAALDRAAGVAPAEGGQPPATPTPLPVELETELIVALGAFPQADDLARLEARLRSDNAALRLAALEGLARCQAPLTDAVLDLRTDPDYRVRVVWAHLVAERGHPLALEWFTTLLRDERIEVQCAALGGFGRLATPEAVERLRTALGDRREAIRAAATESLAAVGQWDLVLARAKDESWRVRRVVATCLGRHPSRDARQTLTALVADPSLETQEAAIRAVQSWSLAEAGPIWLTALERAGYRTRKLAAQLFSERWPAAKAYAADAPPERRSEVLAELRSAWTAQFGRIDAVQLAQALGSAAGATVAATVPPETLARTAQLVEALKQGDAPAAIDAACQELIATGPPLVAALGILAIDQHVGIPPVVYQRVLPAIDPQFAMLAQLADADNALRREAARQLAKLVVNQPLTALALERLAELADQEVDPEVWQNVLVAVADDPREAAARIAYAALQHAVAETRRRGCEYLEHHPDRRHASALVAALDDGHIAVVRAAVRALGQPGVLDDPSRLEALLTSSDHRLRVEAARSLAAMGAAAGVPALERLSLDADPEICRAAIGAMAELCDPVFIPALMALVDHRQEGLDRAAQGALQKIVGQEPPPRSADGAPLPDSAAVRWKAWWEAVRRGQLPAPLGRAPQRLR